MLIGYARVSTSDQTFDLQKDALQKAGCERIFTDTASGAKAERIGLEEAVSHLREGDSLVVWRLDRLGRSLKHLIETITALNRTAFYPGPIRLAELWRLQRFSAGTAEADTFQSLMRFERAGGVCQACGRPHGAMVRSLPDGRWYDPERRTWRDGRGRNACWPDLEQMIAVRATRVVLAAAHLDHDPTNNRLRNLRSLCQRCHMIHDRPYHLAQRRITYLLRRALGDLFLGQYRVG